MELCVECNERPVYIKKRKLCNVCYGKLQRSGINLSPLSKAPGTIAKNRTAKELEFVKNYFDHKDWIYHPALFRFDNEKYSPDFYDIRTNTFIEVAGTRQAYFQNKDKYTLFKKYYPKIKFEIRFSNGELLDETASINSQTQQTF